MNFNTILYTTHDAVTTITLNRPDSYNAFTGEMRSELLQGLQHAAADTGCRCLVLTGAGKAFCSGQDLKDIEGENVDFKEFLKNGYNPIIQAMRTMDKTIVCKLNGVAAGAGCSLALACDYIIADERASLVEVFVGIGLVLDSGSSYFLPRLVGSNKAFELATMGTKVRAQEAVDIGMINKCVAADELDLEAGKIISYYASAPSKAIGMMKKMLNHSMNASLDEMLEMEAVCQEIAGSSRDYTEGVSAFIEKRKPNFMGS